MTRSGFRLRNHQVLARLAARQAGIVTRSQVLRAGLTTEVVGAAVAAERWVELGPILLVTFTGPLPAASQRWAAVLNAGAGAAVAGRTALQVHGLAGWDGDAVEVVVDRGSRPPPLRFARVHESRRHLGTDVTAVQGLPSHTAARAAVDVATWSPSTRTSAGVLAAVVQQRLTTPDQLAETLERQGHIRHRRLLLATVKDLVGGSQALSEIEFARLFRRAGIPAPRQQAIRRDSQGRRRYLDMEWLLPDGSRRVLEIDGVGHIQVERWWDDLLRTADLTVAEESTRVMRLPAASVRTEPQRVLSLVPRFLRLDAAA